MKSIKAGKATSFAGIIGSVILVIFGIAWTLLVISLFSQEDELGTPVFYFFVCLELFLLVLVLQALFIIIEIPTAKIDTRYMILLTAPKRRMPFILHGTAHQPEKVL